MTFLVDPPLLGFIGLLIGARITNPASQLRVITAITAAFLFASILLYLDVVPFWFGEWIAGSTWMLNSGLPTNLTRTPGTDVLAVVILSSYPVWAWAGVTVGRRMTRGVTPP